MFYLCIKLNFFLYASTFNAITGVSALKNRQEIRAFRPILEWRKIIESVGLTDTYLYEMEENDPTVDEMMCFYKESLVQTPDVSLGKVIYITFATFTSVHP